MSTWSLYVPALLASAGFIVAFFVITLWLVSVAIKDSSIPDIFWGPGCAACGWAAWLAVPGAGPRATLMLVAATLWGVRLGLYIGKRNWGAEDRRYARLRKHVEEQGKSYAWHSLRAIFLFQGAAMFVCSLPIVIAVTTPEHGALGAIAYLGFALWLIGLVIESLADAQMSEFRSGPRQPGAVMDRGLWRYSRHPNYFGEMLVQWGLFMVAADIGTIGLLTVIAPLLLSTMIIGPLGANLLERRLGKKNPDYASYIATTSRFIPWPPKRSLPSA
jgi:steroid 5-alpha reductase family enzyme